MSDTTPKNPLRARKPARPRALSPDLGVPKGTRVSESNRPLSLITATVERHTLQGEGRLPNEDAHIEIKGPEAMERDRLTRELQLWEYRERLGKRAAAADRKIRASVVLPAQQLEQVRARQKAAWDYGMRVGRINAEVLGSPLASPKADSSGKDQAVGAAAGGCGGSEVHVERGADAADASGLQESCVQAAASGDSRSCTAAEQQPAGVAALGQGIQQQADLHASSASPWPASPHDEARDGTGATPRSVSPVGAGPEPVAAQQPQDSFREASSTIADAQHAAASGSGTCQTTSKPSSPPDAPIAGTRPAARAAPFNPTAASARLLAYALRPHAGGAGIEGRPPWRHPLEGGRMEQQRQQQHLEEQRHASPVRVGAAPEFPAAAAAARRAAKSGVQQGAAAWWGPVAPPLALVPPRVVQAEPAAPPGALQRPEASAAGTQPAQRQRTACKGGQAGAARLAGPVAAAAVTAPGPYGLPDKADLVRIADKVRAERIQLAPLCACGHGVSPLDPAYTRACCANCPLRRDAGRAAALLRCALDAKGLLGVRQ